MDLTSWWRLLLGAGYFCMIIAFALMLIMKRRPVGSTLAWLFLLFAVPVAGMAAYLILGTRRLGTKRLHRAHALAPTYEEWQQHMQEAVCGLNSCPSRRHNRIYNLAERSMSIPALPGNQLHLFQDCDSIIDALLKDIQHAETSVCLEFYILEQGGRIDDVTTALHAAALRGIQCLVLLDGVGSRAFLNSDYARNLRQAGVQIEESLPVGPLRMLVERMDLRNHRKIAVIDDAIAWTGSYNLIDPRLFKQNIGVGSWIDAMVRIEGPSAHVLGSIVMWDWEMETGAGLNVFKQDYHYQPVTEDDSHLASIHVLPSGPGVDRELLHQVLVAAAYESQDELVISTPYFVPDEALMSALRSAALRGVKVQLIVPEKNDSRLVHYASRSYYEDLLEAGVEIMHFRGGLLHTKCVLVDRETVLFGTVNLDMRSVWLNFEVTLIVYDESFGQRMATLLESYLEQSVAVCPESWPSRPFMKKLGENTAQLLAPLL
ncbi:cardiolipin synthase [Endozoicomonadaceae bacterium StTr2]